MLIKRSKNLREYVHEYAMSSRWFHVDHMGDYASNHTRLIEKHRDPYTLYSGINKKVHQISKWDYAMEEED